MQQLSQSSQESSSLFNLTIEGFRQLQTYGIDLNLLFILECLSEGTDIAKHVSYSKISAWKQNLYRKSLITEKGEVTILGKELLASLHSSGAPKDVVDRISKEGNEGFDKWWSEFPSTDIFQYKGVTFTGSRGLKQRKEECRKKFNEILLEGEHSVDDLITALKREIILKKEQSVTERDNKMRFMQNTLTYLNQRTYENFIHPKGNVILIDSSTGSSSTMDI